MISFDLTKKGRVAAFHHHKIKKNKYLKFKSRIKLQKQQCTLHTETQGIFVSDIRLHYNP